MSNHYSHDNISAFDAISEAQKIAFAPMVFQTAICLRDFGILAFLDDKGKTGATLEEITKNSGLSQYSVSVILDLGLSSRMIYQSDDHYILGKIGSYILHDQMTNVNMNFTQDICYQGMFNLKESLMENKAKGLQVFGDWETIYPGLSQLPAKAKKSWFDYDHFYSDGAFNAALLEILQLNPKHIYDVGGNTGKWALTCCKKDPEINVTIIDLPQQIALAKENIEKAGLTERIHTHSADILTAKTLPTEADLWWMSQFLDCFSEKQIVHILTLIRASLKPGAKVCILEIFWDKQKFEAASFSLNASSLYFTAMANGKSRFYHSEVFINCIKKAGFTISQTIDNLGVGHTLLICEATG